MPEPRSVIRMATVPRRSPLPHDRTFFDLFNEAGKNGVHAAALLDEMMNVWPDAGSLGEQIVEAEHRGDRITHSIVQRLNTTEVSPIDREDVYGLATEEAADFLGLYQVEAPMEQATALTEVLVGGCRHLAAGLEELPSFHDLDRHWIEVHRLENEADRIFRSALASLFTNAIDPMVVIRWKDIFEVLEEAIDATEKAAQILEGIVIKNA